MYSKIVNEYILDNDKIYEEYIYLFGILIYKYKEVIGMIEEVNKQPIGFKLND